MTQLLMKDLRIQRNYMLIGFIAIGFVFFVLGAFEDLPLSIPAAIFSHFLIVVASKMDEKNNNGLMLASFPLRRRDIVTSKYVGIAMFIIIAFAITMIWRFVTALILPTDELPWFSLQSVGLTLVVQLLFYSIYFPLFFAFGSRLAQFLDLIVIFSIGGCAVLALRIMEWSNINIGIIVQEWLSKDLLEILLYAAAGCLFLMFISWRLSVFIYDRKNI
jgi:ABC-2 type transport system permease protein